MEQMLTAQEYGAEVHRTARQVRNMIHQGRIPGARRFGDHYWMIPSGTPWPGVRGRPLGCKDSAPRKCKRKA